MRLPSLAGLRALGILGVFIGHTTALGIFADKGIQEGYFRITSGGATAFLGVSYFFILSGFLLTWTARVGERPTVMWRRRFFRIFPNHIAVFILMAAIILIAGETIHLPQALANLFLVQTWIPDPTFIYYQVNAPTWSLAGDVFCYAAFPALFVVVRKIKASRLWYWLGGLCLLSLSMPLISAALFAGRPTSPMFVGSSWEQMWLLYYFPPTRLIEFTVGMLVARIVQNGDWIRLHILPALALVGVAYALVFVLPSTFSLSALYTAPLALLVGAAVTADRNGRRTFFNNRVLVKLGDLSYAFYILQIPMVFGVHALLSGSWVGYAFDYPRTQFSTPVAIAFIVGLYVLGTLAAWVLHRTVEVPIMRRWSTSRKPPASAKQDTEAQPA
ncbi:acyltransferase family protein [Rhizohabitans arisaemae]|uniref:acyltransferase family protein n=1 Tax=Rhizohabitans arisaemae TaxID=2720610 RepID=UPI0024B20AA2|nr:acyltransferase [Rhizohabitans arisaemae]